MPSRHEPEDGGGDGGAQSSGRWKTDGPLSQLCKGEAAGKLVAGVIAADTGFVSTALAGEILSDIIC